MRQLTPAKQVEPQKQVTEETKVGSSGSDASDNYETGYDEDINGPKVKPPKKNLFTSKFFKKVNDLPEIDDGDSQMDGDDENDESAGEFDWFQDISTRQQFLKTPKTAPSNSKKRTRTTPTDTKKIKKGKQQ